MLAVLCIHLRFGTHFLTELHHSRETLIRGLSSVFVQRREGVLEVE
jgi:hypothetical protein